jgi:hypothetical protein
LLLVGGSGDTAEIFRPLVEKLSLKLPEHEIATFSLSSGVGDGENLLEAQTGELTEVMRQLIDAGRFMKYDIFCTSMGAFPTIKLLIDPDLNNQIRKVVFFDPADYYLSASFSKAEGEITWSGSKRYLPEEPVISGELNKYKGEAVIDVVHLTLRNWSSDGYLDKEYRDRGRDYPGAFPRLSTDMVKSFYEMAPKKNRGKYVEVGGVPHGFMRDGNVQKNIERVVEELEKRF